MRNIHLVELRVWRQFLVLAEELHFGRAAARLNMTQPPLTQAIALLEAQLDVKLFERTRRSVKLTAAGADIVQEVRDLLDKASRIPGRAKAIAGGVAGQLRLAFVSTIGFSRLPHWVRTFRSKHPHVSLELTELTGNLQIEALAAGRIDAGLFLAIPGMRQHGLSSVEVARERLVLAVPTGHKLARTARLDLADIAREPLVIFPRVLAPALHDSILGIYRAMQCHATVSQEANQMQTIVNLVSAGLGIAWVPESVRIFKRPGVAYREAEFAAQRPGIVPEWETRLAWLEGAAPMALMRFLEIVRA